MHADDLEEALRLERDGDLDGALIALEEVLSNAPRHALALARLAQVQMRRNRFEEAGVALDRAEAVSGTTAFTAKLRGDLLAKTRRWADAAKAYQHADALGAKGTWVLVQLARARMQLGDIEGARGAASQAIERDEAASAPWVVLGDLALREHRSEEAEIMYLRAHERAPKDQWAYAKLVEARLLKLPPERRDREIEVLLKSSGRGNRYLVGVLAKLKSGRGDPASAAKTWGSRVREHGDTYARKMQAYALRKAGELDEAAAIFGRCVVEDPHDVVLFRTYVNLQYQRAAFEELRQVLEEALQNAGSRRGAIYGTLRKLPVVDATEPASSAAEPHEAQRPSLPQSQALEAGLGPPRQDRV